MQIVFRTDASVQIGTGHVVRCLTLADGLRSEGADCVFICRGHTGHLVDLIRERGHQVMMLAASDSLQSDANHAPLSHAAWLGTDWATDANESQRAIGSFTADWLVVDHYALDHRWEKAMRPFTHKIMVIDDLADRIHDCDLLLDQNLGRSVEDYRSLAPDHAIKLIGPRYALLRPEFAAMRTKSLARRQHPKLQHLLITLGGVDKDNLTGEVLQTLLLCNLPSDLRITVVMGPYAPWLQNVQEIAKNMPRPTKILVNVNDMGRLMADCDLVIGAAGGTAWERCSLGVPSLVIAAAENQRNGTEALNRSGAIIALEKISSMQKFFTNELTYQKLKDMSEFASEISDGKGEKRITAQIVAQNLSARLATEEDSLLLFNWANEAITRQNAFNSESIKLSDHQSWLNKRLNHPMRYCILIIEKDQSPIGQVRFERNNFDEWEIDYSVAANFRGKFLGDSVLKTGLTNFSQKGNKGVLIGKVKLKNLASCRIFEKIGFQVRSVTSDVVWYCKYLERDIA
jgi:UDP-2,4-diacetamido-2,4,6-trideoxy-beta-L-altropyranose hydrolase